jgi:hypothetical protein
MSVSPHDGQAGLSGFGGNEVRQWGQNRGAGLAPEIIADE